ncbi:MAG: copper homeostasis protein CutC [Mariniblastus sp.]
MQINADKITIEVCAASLESAITAETSGADRIELNSALELDGLTPPAGLWALVTDAIRIPIIAMARPRGGNFVYTESEWRTLIADARWLLQHGAAGIAFGCLDNTGNIQADRCREIRKLAGDRELVFHKAFDEVSDWKSGLEVLVDAGINRVMTSGQQPTAMEGLEVLAALQRQANERIEILPAGRVGSANALQILQTTGAHQLHGSFGSGPDRDVAVEIQRTIENCRLFS